MLFKNQTFQDSLVKRGFSEHIKFSPCRQRTAPLACFMMTLSQATAPQHTQLLHFLALL